MVAPAEPAPAEPAPAKPAPFEAADYPSFEALVAHLQEKGAPVALTLARQLRVVDYRPGHIVYEEHDRLPESFRKRLREELGRATDRVWGVEGSDAKGAPSLADAETAEEDKLRAHPLVQAALAVFPDSKLSIGRPLDDASAMADPDTGPPTDDAEADVVYDDDLNYGDWEPDD